MLETLLRGVPPSVLANDARTVQSWPSASSPSRALSPRLMCNARNGDCSNSSSGPVARTTALISVCSHGVMLLQRYLAIPCVGGSYLVDVRMHSPHMLWYGLSRGGFQLEFSEGVTLYSNSMYVRTYVHNTKLLMFTSEFCFFSSYVRMNGPP